MSVGIIVLIVVAILIIALVIWAIKTYNKFVQLDNRVTNAWAQIDVQLQRRNDLIPNLIETVKGYASHEKQTLTDVIDARNKFSTAETVDDKIKASNVLTDTLKSLFAVAEQYPDLKANTNFLELQGQLEETEDQISYMRQSFNDVIMMFNNAIKVFPSSIIAGMFHFTPKDSFAAAESAKEVPQVKF